MSDAQIAVILAIITFDGWKMVISILIGVLAIAPQHARRKGKDD